MTEAVAPQAAASHVRPVRLLSDNRLMRLAANGDRRAFAEIYRRHHQELYRYCLAILRSPEDARDALQSTMTNALRSLPGERRQIALKPWLYRVAHNEAITALRQRLPGVPLETATEPEGPSANQQAEERFRLRELVNDLSSLPERQKGALVMRELSGLSYSEIGSAFETSSAAAKQTVYEARAALHEIAGGREMDCEAAREALSANDGRVLRGRKLRAHLRHCSGCRDFRAAIGQRRSDLAALTPALPAVAAAGLLNAILGNSGNAAGSGLIGLVGGGGAKTLAGSGGLKVGAAVLATAAIGVGTADVTGVVNTPLVGSSGSNDAGQSSSSAATQGGGTDGGAVGTTSIDQISGGRSGPQPKTGHAGGSEASAGRDGSSSKAPASSAPAVSPASGVGDHHASGHLKAKSQAHPTHPTHPTHPIHPTHPAHPLHPPTAVGKTDATGKGSAANGIKSDPSTAPGNSQGTGKP